MPYIKTKKNLLCNFFLCKHVMLQNACLIFTGSVSIHLFSSKGRGGMEFISSVHWARSGVQPEQATSPLQGSGETDRTNNHARTHGRETSEPNSHVLVTVGGSRSIHRELKCPQDSNPGPSC